MDASQAARAALPGHHPRDREASPASPHGQREHAGASCAAGLGAVSPAWGKPADLCARRPSGLSPAGAGGAAEPPAPSSPVDAGPGRARRRREERGVLWARHACPWDTTGRAPVPRLPCADASAHHNPGRGPSVCAAGGTVLGSPAGPTDGAPSAGPTVSAASVAGARRPRCGRSAAPHAADWLAEPASGMAPTRRLGPCRQPRLAPSKRPCPGSPPRMDDGETASATGRWPGLSGMQGHWHVSF